MVVKRKRSKKRSATRRKERPEKLTFFLDKCLGRNSVRNALLEAGCGVEILIDHFPEETPDQIWLAGIKEHPWVVLTKDNRIRFNQVEVEALWNSKKPVFVLTSADLRGAEMAAAFIKALPNIRNMLSTYEPPFLATTSAGGSISMLKRGSDILRRLQDFQQEAENIERTATKKRPPQSPT